MFRDITGKAQQLESANVPRAGNAPEIFRNFRLDPKLIFQVAIKRQGRKFSWPAVRRQLVLPVMALRTITPAHDAGVMSGAVLST